MLQSKDYEQKLIYEHSDGLYNKQVKTVYKIIYMHKRGFMHHTNKISAGI